MGCLETKRENVDELGCYRLIERESNWMTSTIPGEMIHQSFLQESERIQTALKILHKEEVAVINVVDLLDAIRNGLGLHGIVIITSEIVEPTQELISKLNKKAIPLEENGIISIIFRPALLPHHEENSKNKKK